MLMLTGETPPINPLIQTVIQVQTPVVEPEEKIYTIEEKIAMNYYGCNEQTEWIRADDATCLPKQVNTRLTAQNTPRGAVRGSQAPSGWYPYGQCTYLVWSERPVGQWNNASQWLAQAQRDGWATGSTPQVGAIAWEPNHVSLVVAVNDDGTIRVKEMNYVGLGVISYRTAPATQFKYIY